MECTTTREQLLDPIAQADRVTGKHHSLPVLTCVLLTVEGAELSVAATNLEVGVRYTVPVKNCVTGSVAVQGGVLAHVLSMVPQGAEVTLKTEEGYLEVCSVGGASKLTLHEVDDFPQLPQVADGVTVQLPAKELKQALESVSYCASSSTIKPELASVFVHPDGGVLIAAATDSFRLAEERIPLKQAVTTDPFLIPAKSCADLMRLLERADGTVECMVGAHQFSITLPGVYLTFRLTAGTFPDYTAFIPKTFVSEVTVLVRDLDRVLRKATVFSDQFNQTTLTISPKKKEFSVHTANQTIGETQDEVPAALSGERLEIRFNHKYLIDALRSISTDSVALRFAGPSQVALIAPVGAEGFRYMLMPMNR